MKQMSFLSLVAGHRLCAISDFSQDMVISLSWMMIPIAQTQVPFSCMLEMVRESDWAEIPVRVRD